MASMKILFLLTVCAALICSQLTAANPVFGNPLGALSSSSSQADSHSESSSKSLGGSIGIPLIGQIFQLGYTENSAKADAHARADSVLRS